MDQADRKPAETSRRNFLTTTALGAAALGVAFITGRPSLATAADTGPFTLPPLPWQADALAPHISARTIDFHYSRHHAGYVKKLNRAVAGTDLAALPLDRVIKASFGRPGIYNNAAQVWNHTFYWNSMKPGGGGEPSGELAKRLAADFGSVNRFKDAFHKAAATRFGSGWAWLVEEDGKLKVTATMNADTPMSHNQKALLTIDVWEHAYYLDWQNRRKDYIKAFLSHLINWDFAAANLG